MGGAAGGAVPVHHRPGYRAEPTEVVIGFEGGLPVSLDGEALGLVELIGRLNRQAGAYGIGRST